MNKCYLGLGSNQKNPERQIRKALSSISAIPSTAITKSSELYWSPAWGLHQQQDFCNMVIEIVTRLSPYLLLKQCNSIEEQLGRVRKKRWGPRIIDIDIILYGNRIINTSELTIPHPYYKIRDFVTKPLLQINSQIL